MPEREIFDYETGRWVTIDDGQPAVLDAENSSPGGSPYGPPPAAPAVPAVPPVGSGGGGKTRQQIEDEGRAYDAANGLIGGYFDTVTGQWVNGSPSSGGGDSGGGGLTNPYEFGPEPTEAAFNWSRFTPSPFVSSIGLYRPTTLQEAENDPGYQFARDQGRKTLENSAAGRGVLRTGGTLKDILEYGNKFAEQNYQSVDNRRFRNWGANTDLEFRTYDTNYRGQKDAFDAVRDSERLTFQDQYNRWRDRLNSLTQLSTAGMNS
jgi:hypothetical protein